MNLKTLFTTVIAFATFTFSHAQWTQSSQPTGGNCWGIERVHSEIWGAYIYGIYISVNDGATWTKHPTINYPVMDIKAIGDTIILITEENPSAGVYNLSTISSYDGGATWNTPVVAETGNTYYTWGTRSFELMDSALILNSNGDDYYISFDYAQSWAPVNFPIPQWPTMTGIGDRYMVCRTYDGISYANHYTADYGANWNFLDSNYASSNSLIIDSTIYISTGYTDSITHSFIARSSDFGSTWDTLALDLLSFSGTLEYFDNKIFYSYYPYPGAPIKYESGDGGNTWTLSAMPPEVFWLMGRNAIILSNWEWLISQYNFGMYRYNPSTSVCYHTETGIKARRISFLHNNKGVLYSKADDLIYISYDAGTTWIQAPDFVYGSSDLVFVGDSVFGTTSSGEKLCFSYDNGQTWDSTLSSGCWVQTNTMTVLNGKLYISGYSGMAVSDDWGASWTCLSSTVDSTCGVQGVDATHLAVCNNELFAFDDKGQVSKFDTVSQSWIRKLCISMPGVQYSMLFSSGGKLAATGGGDFKVSADSGNTWYSPAMNGFPSGYATSVSEVDGIWFAPRAGKLYYTFDYGDNWQQLPTNVDMYMSQNSEGVVTSLNGILYAGGNNVWKSDDTLQLISGNVFFDPNNNGIKDGGEAGIHGIILHTTPHNIAFNTDSTGNYAFFTAASGDTLRPALPTNYCSSKPASYITNGAASNVDFGLYFYPGVQDLTVDITNRSIFRPGFKTFIDVTIKNHGTIPLPGFLEVVLDTSLVYINASVTPAQINNDTLIFAIDTLQLLESVIITIETETFFTVPVTTPVLCTATIFPVAGDTVSSDNYSEIIAVVTGSYDPNDKTAACGPYFTPAQLQNGDEMIYTIRFQNMGTFQADNIYIIDTLSQFFLLENFRIISSSHAMHYTMQGNGIVTFYFDNIFLPDMTTDEPGSHGFVKYAVKCNPNLTIGDAIDNTAYIYFDFNPPVQTNTETIIIADPPLNVNTTEVDDALKMNIFPNPATNTLNGIFNSGKSKSFRLTIFTSVGQPVINKSYTGDRFSIGLTDLNAGLYFGKITFSDDADQLFFRFMVTK